jgi:hypothetical protein
MPASNINSADFNSESQLILHMIENVKWPSDIKSGKEIVIAVLGDSDLTIKLQEEATKKNNLNIRVKNIGIDDDVSDIHVFFIGSTELSSLAKALKKVREKPVLTISDNKGFARYGVMIEIIKSNGTIEYAVNKMTIKEVKLEISQKVIDKAKTTFG